MSYYWILRNIIYWGIIICVVISSIVKIKNDNLKGVDAYKCVIIRVSFAMIFFYFLSILDMVLSVTGNVSFGGHDATGLGDILNIFVAFSIPFLIVILGFIILIRDAIFVGLLWIVYKIWKNNDSKAN